MLLFIPGYNCESQITRVLSQVDNQTSPFIDEIIFVNNRSTDSTEQRVLDYLEHAPKSFPPTKILRNNNNYNLGGSHKVAFDYAKSRHHNYLIVLHGDDQADLHDLLPILRNKSYEHHDAMLGSRFMEDSRLEGYSKFRTFGNRVYNQLFSFVTHRQIYDLGSGLNLYKVSSLTPAYYFQFPDALTFNYCMILAAHYHHQDIAFFPISWRESDQKSNVKLFSQAVTVLKLLAKYHFHPAYLTTELRTHPITEYTYTEVTHA